MPVSTPTRPKPLGDMVAVSKDSKVKALGFVCWFSVPDRPVNLKTLKRAWLMAGLDPKPLPADPRALYLFKRAVREQEGKVRHDDGSTTETDVVDVLETGELCVYQIARVVRDADRREADYPKALRVIYLKATEEITFSRLGETKTSEVRPMMGEIVDYVEQNTKVIDGRKVRTLVRTYLQNDNDEQGGVVGLAGTNLRGKSGGIYFVAAKYKDELDGLAAALDDLYASEGVTYGLSMAPLADGASERELIRRQYVATTLEETEAAIAGVAKLLRSDRKNAVRSDVREHWFRKLAALRRRAADYQKLLREEDADIVDMTAMMAKQLERLPQ